MGESPSLRRIVLKAAGAAVATGVLAACASGSAATTPTGPVGSDGSAVPVVAAAMSNDQAKDYFLTTVCPVTTSLKLIENIEIEAGGWKSVDPKKSKVYMQSAADESRKAASKLTADGVTWPEKLSPSIQGMKENFLGFIVPLQQMVQATSGASMATPWQQVALNPRIAEQQARLDLGLPAANAANDGCPPVPKPSPRPVVTSSPNTSGKSNAGGSNGGGANNWQSPSGNLRCAYFASGSAGESVACMDGDNNRLVILNHGYSRTSDASQTQRDQLQGGSVVDFGESRTLGGGSFVCGLTDNGMTCRDMQNGAWFIIRRGYLWTSN